MGSHGSPAGASAFLGPAVALASALLFGASTPIAKLLLEAFDPLLLAGVLYLGSGLGLAIARGARALILPAGRREAGACGRDWLWLGAAILCGGVIGPVLLMTGLAATPASSAALLLNLEGVLTALLAWFVFRENFDRRVALGMALIAAGAVLLSWQGTPRLPALFGPLAIAGACLAWAFDNNLTRKVSLADPLQIAMLKGLIAGTFTTLLALGSGAALPGPAMLGLAATVGLLGYGLSLVLFVIALRHLGTARTGAYYSVAPFMGAALAIALGDRPDLQFALAGLLMAAGVWLHLTERHAHLHEHEPLDHTHLHRHDEHHRHAHRPGQPAGEPHTHRHVHAGLRHMHRHFPDAHHRHEH